MADARQDEFTELFAAEYPHGLDEEITRLCGTLRPGARAALWCFDPAPARRAAEARLAAAGIDGRVRFAFRAAESEIAEEMRPGTGDRLVVEWPRGRGGTAGRFLQELQRLPSRMPCPVETRACDDLEGECVATLHRADGGSERRRLRLPCSMRPTPGGGEALAACGWLRVETPEGAVEEGPWRTPLEAAVFDAFGALEGLGWSGRGPHFGTLRLRLEAPLETGAESLAEALHEELYFGALEICRRRAGLPEGDRTLQPGSIVPEVVAVAGLVGLRLEATPPRTGRPPERTAPSRAGAPDLDACDRPITAAEARAALQALGGRALTARSREGRVVEARLLSGRGPSVMISAAQHANEPTGVVGALRAARVLARDGVQVAVCPVENPDGLALYERLLRDAPDHMHHAARYTASGADLACVPGFEADMRVMMRDETGAELHLSLHGYPAHEWTRPFTGYLPRGFEGWSLPRGVFLILRHAPGRRSDGIRALKAAAAALQDDAEIVALNRAQLAHLRRFSLGPAPERIGDVPVLVEERDDGAAPVTLITEAPDETIRGARFRVLARAQEIAAVAAARVWAGGR